jgi:hypothetical protein
LSSAVTATGGSPTTQLTAFAFGTLSVTSTALRVEVPENATGRARAYSPFIVVRGANNTVVVKVALNIGQRT